VKKILKSRVEKKGGTGNRVKQSKTGELLQKGGRLEKGGPKEVEKNKGELKPVSTIWGKKETRSQTSCNHSKAL